MTKYSSSMTSKVSSSIRERWQGAGGIGEVLRIALPLAMSTGCVSLALFTDRTMLHHHSGSEMAASMPGGNLFWTFVCFPVGVAGMTSAFISQYVGAHQYERIGRLLFQAIWLSVLAGIAVLGILPWAEDIFRATGQSEALIPLQSAYFRVLLWCGIAVILESALSGFFSGTDRPSIILWVNIAATLMNIVLDGVMIFGYAGFPELGIRGAAWATVISLWFKVLIYGYLIYARSDRKKFGLYSQMQVDLPLAKHLLTYSIPAGLQYLLESGGFMVIVLQIGQLGEAALSATSMAINFNILAFVPLMGISIAASVSVGRHLRETGPTLASRAARSALYVGAAYTAVCAAVYLFVPRWILGLYQLGTPDLESAQAAAIAVTLLRFVAAYCVIDALQLILAGALRGAGDTWFVLVASCSCTVGTIGLGWLLESMVPVDLLYWWWIVITAMVWALAVVFTWRFMSGRWQDKTLLEKSDLPPVH